MKKIIVDANQLSIVFRTPCAQHYLELHQALILGKRYKVAAMVGGRLRKEYWAVKSLRRLLLELNRIGRILFVNDPLVDNEEAIVKALAHRSDDPHVIALGRVSGARVLVSADRNLIFDWRDPALIRNPRGSVYSGAKSHAHLLRA